MKLGTKLLNGTKLLYSDQDSRSYKLIFISYCYAAYNLYLGNISVPH